MVADKMELVHQSRDIFAAPHLPFPAFLTGTPASIQPWQGVIDIDAVWPLPSSISVALPISHAAAYQVIPEAAPLQMTFIQAESQDPIPDM